VRQGDEPFVDSDSIGSAALCDCGTLRASNEEQVNGMMALMARKLIDSAAASEKTVRHRTPWVGLCSGLAVGGLWCERAQAPGVAQQSARHAPHPAAA
jgi:hypothetical protein